MYVSGGRNETVVMGGLEYGYNRFGFDLFGKDCYVTVNETPCNICAVTCTEEWWLPAIGVNCENIVTGASYDTCSGSFVVDTYEFGMCYTNQTQSDL
jgi:hypothetical protein